MVPDTAGMAIQSSGIGAQRDIVAQLKTFNQKERLEAGDLERFSELASSGLEDRYQRAHAGHVSEVRDSYLKEGNGGELDPLAQSHVSILESLSATTDEAFRAVIAVMTNTVTTLAFSEQSEIPNEMREVADLAIKAFETTSALFQEIHPKLSES